MSKIKVQDWANYVENSKQLGIDILNIKNVNVSKSTSLSNVINKIAELPSKSDSSVIPDTDKYIPDPYFAKMEEDYLNDPLRTKNGGIYSGCKYVVLIAAYDTTFISGAYGLVGASTTNPAYIVTSDGQEFTKTSPSDFTITWDKSKDIDALEDGTVVRWIKVYRTKASRGVFPCYPTSTVTDPQGMVVMFADDYSDGLSTGTTSSGAHQCCFNTTHIRYIVLDDTVESLQGSFKYAYSLECIKHLGQSLEIITLLQLNDIVPAKAKLEATVSKLSNQALTADSINHICLEDIAPGLDLRNVEINYSNDFLRGFYSKNDIVLPDEVESLGNGIYITNFKQKILSIPIQQKYYGSRFRIVGYYLNIITIPGNFSQSLWLTTPNLFKSSLISIFSNLKDLSGETSKTITISKFLQYKLTEEDLAIAQNKNWTVTFS